MKRFVEIIIILTTVVGCQKVKELSVPEKEAYLTIGDSISNQVQAVLLSNVSQKIQESGVVQAIEFCSEKALFFTDSLSVNHQVKIQRLTDRNRNPNNGLQSEMDQKIWNEFRLNPKNNQKVFEDNGSVFYYKTISMGMPACLRCHGDKETDIEPETRAYIQMKYPNDLATGYELGTLRGMWKMEWKR